MNPSGTIYIVQFHCTKVTVFGQSVRIIKYWSYKRLLVPFRKEIIICAYILTCLVFYIYTCMYMTPCIFFTHYSSKSSWLSKSTCLCNSLQLCYLWNQPICFISSACRWFNSKFCFWDNSHGLHQFNPHWNELLNAVCLLTDIY